MKDTGIARRVDQLGRIVLPMEIRKKLKIFEGTLLELSLDGDVIKMEKYSPLLNFKQYAQDILDECEFPYFVCDDSSVVLANKNYIKLLDEKIDYNTFLDSSEYTCHQGDFLFTENFVSNYLYNYIFPIKKDGDTFGCVCFGFCNEMSGEMLGQCKFIAKYISSKL